MRRLIYISLFLVVVSAVIGCRRVPSYVLSPDQMAEILADMYVADGVIDHNHNQYMGDSTRLLLRQSILARHDADQARFDTSLVWYGHNMELYLEVYDHTIEILQERERALGTAIVQNAVSISGDSVDVWPASRYVCLNDRMPSRLVYFAIQQDDNWEPGDVYTWRFKFVDEGARSVKWTMYAEYADSTGEWLSASTSTQPWHEMIFPTDSTKTLTDIKGYFEVIGEGGEALTGEREFWIDSISLVRKRTNPEFYRHRHRLRTYRDFK